MPDRGSDTAVSPVSPLSGENSSLASSTTQTSFSALAKAASTGVRLRNLFGRVLPQSSTQVAPVSYDEPVSAASFSGGTTGTLAREGGAFSSAPGQLSPPGSAISLGAQDMTGTQAVTLAAAAGAQGHDSTATATTPRLLARLTSSLRRKSQSTSPRAAATAAAGAPLGMLVADEEHSKAGTLESGPVPGSAAGAMDTSGSSNIQAEAAEPGTASTTPAAVSAGAGVAPAVGADVDGVVQVSGNTQGSGACNA